MNGSCLLAKSMLSDVLFGISSYSGLDGVTKVLAYAPGTQDGEDVMLNILDGLGLKGVCVPSTVLENACGIRKMDKYDDENHNNDNNNNNNNDNDNNDEEDDCHDENECKGNDESVWYLLPMRSERDGSNDNVTSKGNTSIDDDGNINDDGNIDHKNNESREKEVSSLVSSDLGHKLADVVTRVQSLMKMKESRHGKRKRNRVVHVCGEGGVAVLGMGE